MESTERRAGEVSAGLLVAGIAAVKLLLHLYAGRYYGFFVDELYNLALARHLAWGYVDVAPMIALLGRMELAIFGDSLTAIRLFPAIAGAGLVVLTAAIARQLGGGQVRAGVCSALRAARARLPGARSFSERQRLRTALLDGVRLAGDPHHRHR